MVISFSKFKNGCGGATGGTVSGITLWSADYTREYIDSVVSGYTKTEDFATINGSAITEGGNLVIQGGSGGTEYYPGTNIDITNNVISVTGITVPTDISDLNDDIGIATTAWTNSAISGTMSAYTPTSGFSTINGSAITNGDNLVIEGTPYSGGTGIGIENHIVSVTGDYETVVELTQAEYDALTAYSENTTYIITDAPAINMSAYTPTSGFSTINGSAITTGGNIVIQGGSNYSAGTNIDITNDVISVTGITVPTKLSDLTNDEGFITQSDIPTSNTAFTNDAGYVNSGEVETQITSKDYPTKNWVQGHVTLAISGKLDTNVFTAYTANTQTELDNKQDASAMTAYYTSAQTETAIQNATAATTGWVENQGYLTAYTETDPVFMSSPASGITVQDISNWDNKLDASALTPYYTSAQTDTAISNAVSGKVDTSTFEQAALYIEQEFINVGTALDGKVDTSAMTEYYTSAETETAIQNATSGFATEQYVDNAIAAIDIPTVPTNVSEFVNDAGYITSDYVDNAVSGKADTSAVTQEIATALEDYTPTSGLTIPTKTSDLVNDSGFITSSDIPTSNTAFTNDAGFVTSGEVETQITGKGYATEQYVNSQIGSAITSETARTESTYAKIGDIPSLDGYATTGWVESQGYLKEHQDISGKLDTSAFTAYTATTQTELDNKQDASAMTAYATTAFTEQTYLKEHQSLSAYSTTQQVQTLINTAKQEVENEIPDVSDFVTSAQVNTQIESKGYITGYTETDPVFMSSPASGITANDITNWNGKQPAGDYALRSELPTVPTSNTAFTNDAGYITDAALNGYATTAFTEQTYLKEHQSLSAYTPTSGMATINGSAITEGGNIVIQGGSASYSAGTNIDITNDVISVTGITVPTNTSQLTNDSRFIPYTTTSSVGILGVRVLTQAQYDALSPANPNTIYIIVG